MFSFAFSEKGWIVDATCSLAPLEQALMPLITIPARIYGLENSKGALGVGMDADLLTIDPASFEIRNVVALGSVAVRNKIVEKKEYFES